MWLWHVPNVWGKSKHNLLKNAKGRLCYFLICPTFYFLKSKLSAKLFTCPRGKPLLGNCRPYFLEHKFVRALLLPTVWRLAQWRISGHKTVNTPQKLM